MEKVTALGIGIEIYVDNLAVSEIDATDAKALGLELRNRAIVCTVHAPFMDLSPGGVDADVRNISRAKIRKAIDIANHIGARGIVCHGAYDRWRFDGREGLWLENSVETWTDALKAAGDLPIMIENIFEEEPSPLIALFDHFKEKNLWLCFDTGHFNLFTTLPLMDWLAPFKGRIMEFHIHDNHGRSDEHLPVGHGTFPFRELKGFIRSLSGILFTAEAHSEATALETIKCAKEFLS
jgi:sugar phosphate isomerase/epimerase